MSTSHDIQQAIEPQRGNDENQEKSTRKDIQQSIDTSIANDAEKSVRDSGQDLISNNLAPDGRYYPFRILERNRKVELVVIEWFKNRSNIERVAERFGRKLAPDPRSHLLQWFLISTASMPRPGTMKEGMSPDDKTKIIVWIALGHNGPDNGLLHDMESGQDMSLDGREKITFSGKPGGLAVLLLLSM